MSAYYASGGGNLRQKMTFGSKLLQKKYMCRDTVSSVTHRLDYSSIWADLLKINPIYLTGRSISVRNGRITSFWLDSWLGDKPLCTSFPVLFDMCVDKHISIFL